MTIIFPRLSAKEYCHHTQICFEIRIFAKLDQDAKKMSEHILTRLAPKIITNWKNLANPVAVMICNLIDPSSEINADDWVTKDIFIEVNSRHRDPSNRRFMKL